MLNYLILFLLLIWCYGGRLKWNDRTCWRTCSVCLTHADVILEFLGKKNKKIAECAFAWGSTAARYRWLITLHATATVKHRSEDEIWFMGLENYWEGGLEKKTSHDSRSSGVISFLIKCLFFFRRSRMWTVCSRAIFSHHPCRLQAFHVSITFFFMRLTWWPAWEWVSVGNPERRG